MDFFILCCKSLSLLPVEHSAFCINISCELKIALSVSARRVIIIVLEGDNQQQTRAVPGKGTKKGTFCQLYFFSFLKAD